MSQQPGDYSVQDIFPQMKKKCVIIESTKGEALDTKWSCTEIFLVWTMSISWYKICFLSDLSGRVEGRGSGDILVVSSVQLDSLINSPSDSSLAHLMVSPGSEQPDVISHPEKSRKKKKKKRKTKSQEPFQTEHIPLCPLLQADVCSR